MPYKTPSKRAANAVIPAARSRPDYSTLAGIAIALAGILGGLLLEKGSMLDVTQATAALIVLGGTFGAVLVSTPLPVFLRALRALRGVFFESPVSTAALIESLIQLATSARKHGIVSLEMEVESLSDPFLRKAMGLAVDGADLQELRNMMEIDLAVTEQGGDEEAKVWETAGGYSPTIGIIGAVMGLLQVMKHLEDIKIVGHGIGAAFVATLYGVGAANIFFLPAAAKLRARMRQTVLVKEMTLEGVAGISQGLNPTLIRLKLESYDQEAAKTAKSAKRDTAPKRNAIETASADGLESA
jgi:chemotaxis protein MotA